MTNGHSRRASDLEGGMNIEAECSREVEIARWLKEMVAVARCNPHAVSAPYIAAHAIHRFAVELQDPIDQSSVVDFLEEVGVMGWPTDLTRRWLGIQWGWLGEYSNEDFL
jgi:hypothetical protein